jgi:mRNA-degrading endonuclease toxin of MazEF toxin-antitoxin module
MKRGDVVLVDLLYTDRTASKVRPALVVQADDLNRQLTNTIVAVITSSQRRNVGAASQLSIDISTEEGRQTGLATPSVLQCENLVAVGNSFVFRKVGRFSDRLMQQVNKWRWGLTAER